MIKAVPRGFTGNVNVNCFFKRLFFVASADAYLTPKIQEYIHGFLSGFENQLHGVRVLFMQSDGGLCPVDE